MYVSVSLLPFVTVFFWMRRLYLHNYIDSLDAQNNMKSTLGKLSEFWLMQEISEKLIFDMKCILHKLDHQNNLTLLVLVVSTNYFVINSTIAVQTKI